LIPGLTEYYAKVIDDMRKYPEILKPTPEFFEMSREE